MSHCPLLKAVRPEQPPRYGANLSARTTINFALRWLWTWWTALSTLAMFCDFPFPGRAVRPHAITCPVESIGRFWRDSTRSLVSCPLLRAARSRSSSAAAATIRTLRQVTRLGLSASLPFSLGASVVASAFRSSAASSSGTLVSNPSICLSQAATQASSRCLSSVAQFPLHSPLSIVPLAGPQEHPLQRWKVLPHCQHTGRQFLRFSVFRARFDSDGVGASLTGTSSWPSRSTPNSRCCFTSRSRIPSMKALAASV
jgi:hypothetical protein